MVGVRLLLYGQIFNDNCGMQLMPPLKQPKNTLSRTVWKFDLCFSTYKCVSARPMSVDGRNV